MRLALEQIDLIRRMCSAYPELELVTSADGEPGKELGVDSVGSFLGIRSLDSHTLPLF